MIFFGVPLHICSILTFYRPPIARPQGPRGSLNISLNVYVAACHNDEFADFKVGGATSMWRSSPPFSWFQQRVVLRGIMLKMPGFREVASSFSYCLLLCDALSRSSYKCATQEKIIQNIHEQS